MFNPFKCLEEKELYSVYYSNIDMWKITGNMNNLLSLILFLHW